MDLAHGVIGGRRHYGAGIKRLAVLAPTLPNPCKGQRAHIVGMYVPRKASPLGRLGPFVKPICRDQASPFTAGRAKRGFLSYGFAARIDQQWPVVWLLVPMRNESPPHRPQSAPLIRRHNRNRIGWTDVIVLLGGQVV